MKKTLALLLALLTVGASFVACGDKTPDAMTSGETTTAATEPAVTEETPDLPDPASVDIAGEFNILVSGNYARNDFAAEGMDGTAVEQAIYRRNQVMKETWGVDIKNEDITRFGSAGGTGDGYTKIYTDYMAGDANYDAAMIGTYDVATLAYSGYIHDLCDIPHIDLTKSWWDKRANDSLAVRGVMFFTTGELTVSDNNVAFVILFNKDLRKAYDLDDPYQLVYDGEWTLDTFGALCKTVTEDLDQSGTMDANDRFGLLVWDDSVVGIVNAAGQRCCTIAEDGTIGLTLYNETTLAALDKYFSIIYDTQYALTYQREKVDPLEMWQADKGLFWMNIMDRIPQLRGMESDFGILPYPKYEATQADYGHLVSAWHAEFLCIPQNVNSLERSGYVTELLAYQGKKLLTPAYYEKTLVGQYTRDEESADMLDIIFATRVFDVGIYYNIGTYKNELGRLFVNRSSIASIYETYRSNAEATIAAINETFSKSIGE